MSKTLLITGASGGLGLATTVLAAKAGYRVYASMRDPDSRKLQSNLVARNFGKLPLARA